MSCPTCAFEGVERQAECPKCRDAQAASCAECGTRVWPDANFCSGCGCAIERSGSVPPQAGNVRAPVRSMQQLLASRAAIEGERKLVTVLFADLRGSLGLLSGMDPEDGQALLDSVVTTMMEAVHRYEGAVNQVMGDGIMALFGAPVAHEDHALRAACAALAMQEAVRGLRDPSWDACGVRPQIRVGLHSGEVAIRSVRSDLSVDYRAVGPTTHIAARMEQLAPPGGVWLTGETSRLGRGLLRTRVIGPKPVKGVTEPIEVHELEGISVRTRFQANALRGLSPLVGRETTRAQLQAALASAAGGSSRVAVLCGDPGVGKSRLCYELVQSAAVRFRVLEASALSYLSTRPQGLLASMARSLFRIGDDDDVARLRAKAETCLAELGDGLPAQLHVALELLDVPSGDREWARLEPVQRRRRIERLLRALLEAYCARGPAILLCEDLHWCDADSLEFISRLVESPAGRQTLILLTHRPELRPAWPQAPHVLSCRIDALDGPTSEALLANLIGADVSLAPLRAWLATRTDGNPFFIEESARAVLETGLVAAEAAVREHADVPASIDALLGARIDRLREPALELLQAAAVIGDDGPAELLRGVAGAEPSEFAARLEVLSRAELLYETARIADDDGSPPAAAFRFKHALIQEVVYKRLVRPRRRALHAAVVEVIERQYGARLAEYIGRLAEHAYRAELWDKCAEYQKLACIRAADRSANDAALSHLERGIEALGHMADTPETVRAAIDLRLTALAVLLPMGAHERVIELLREAEQLALKSSDLPRLARVSSQLSAEFWCVARYPEAREAGERSLSLARELGGDQFALEAAARYNIAMIQHARGEFAAAYEGLCRLLAAFTGKAAQRRLGWAGYPSVLIRTFIISVSAMTGSFADAARAFQEGSALADGFDHPFSRTMILEQYAMCLLVQGENARASELLRRALEVCVADEVRTMYVPIATHLGLALLALGKYEEGLRIIEEAGRAPLDRAGHYAIGYLQVATAEAQRCAGQLVAARETAERAVRDTEACGERGFQVRALLQLAAVLADSKGESGRSLDVFARGLSLARELNMPPWIALAHQGAGRVHAARGELNLAARAYDAALEIWRALEVPAQQLSVERWRGELRQR